MITLITIWLEATNEKFRPTELYWGTAILDFVFLAVTTIMIIKW